MILTRALATVVLAGALTTGCYISATPDAGPACAQSTCGCFEEKHMVFTGRVLDAQSSECLRFELVRLRDRDGTVSQEDRSRSDGTYRLEGDVERPSNTGPGCIGGEPTVREELDPGATPTWTFIPLRTPVSDGNEQIDFLRFPHGTTDAGGVVPPNPCLPPRVDGGTADAG